MYRNSKNIFHTIKKIAYYTGTFAPLCFSYVIGMQMANELTNKSNINQFYFKTFWNILHYMLCFLSISLFIRRNNDLNKLNNKLHMKLSGKC